jgi:uncharacterized protein
MKVVVTGATGFIGRHLVRALLDRGDSVLALTRDSSRAGRVLGPSVEVLHWNPPMPGPWMGRIDGVDAIVNLAGAPIEEELWAPVERAVIGQGGRVLPALAQSAGKLLSGTLHRRRSDRERGAIEQSRVDSTRLMVEAIAQAEHRPRVLVNGSAIGFYGPSGDASLAEGSSPGNDFVARVVRDWEDAARPVQELGVRLVLLRTGIVLGAGDGALPEFVVPFRLFAGGTMGYRRQWVSWIHIEDEIGLIVFALDTPTIQGPLNATAPNPVTMEEFSRQIGSALHRPAWFPFMPLVLRLVLGERTDAVLSSQRVVPEVAARAGYPFRFTDSGEALQEILRR